MHEQERHVRRCVPSCQVRRACVCTRLRARMHMHVYACAHMNAHGRTAWRLRSYQRWDIETKRKVLAPHGVVDTRPIPASRAPEPPRPTRQSEHASKLRACKCEQVCVRSSSLACTRERTHAFALVLQHACHVSTQRSNTRTTAHTQARMQACTAARTTARTHAYSHPTHTTAAL